MPSIVAPSKNVTIESPVDSHLEAKFREARKYFNRVKPVCRKKNKYEERLTHCLVMRDCSYQNEEWAIKLKEKISYTNSGII